MISEQNSNVEEPDHFEVSVDLQRDILNLILTDRDFLINSLSLVKPDYFEDYAHQQICKKCQDYFQEYNDPITLDILSQEIKNAFEINRQLPRILSEIDIVAERINEAYKEKAYLNKAVVDFAKKQAMKFAIMKSVDLLSENKYDQIEQLIRDALLVAPNVSLGMNYFDDVSERYQRILMQLQGERFTTGWPTIDMNLNGGMGKKEVGNDLCQFRCREIYLVWQGQRRERDKRQERLVHFMRDVRGQSINSSRFDGIIDWNQRFDPQYSRLEKEIAGNKRKSQGNILYQRVFGRSSDDQ